MIKTIPLLLILQLSFTQFSKAQLPNYSGTWELNLAKSKLEHQPEGLTGSTFVIQQTADQLTLSRTHFFADKQKRIRFQMKADGKTRRIKLLFKGKLEWVNGHLKASLWRKNFSNIVAYQFGANNNEFIADEVFKGLPQDHHNIWVFDRKQTLVPK